MTTKSLRSLLLALLGAAACSPGADVGRSASRDLTLAAGQFMLREVRSSRPVDQESSFLLAEGVSWTRRGFDTRSRDPREVAARLTRGMQAGDILLLHDGGSARTAAGAPVVLEALARVLECAAAQGLRPVALHQALDP